VISPACFSSYGREGSGRERERERHNNTKIITSFYIHKNIHIYTRSARNSKTVNDHLIANSKLTKLFLDVTLYRLSDTGSDQLLTLAKLRFPPKCLHLPQNTARKENIHYKTKLLNDKSLRRLHKQRIVKRLQEIPESSNIVCVWRNVKTVISQAAGGSLG
jgi:hypothetical protein